MPGCILIGKDPMTNKDFLNAYKENENEIDIRISLQPLRKIYTILTLSKNKKLNKMMNKILNTYYKIAWYGRIELRNAKENLPESLQIKLNEINTIPGYTPISMYPKLWMDCGVDIKEQINKHIEYALEESNG